MIIRVEVRDALKTAIETAAPGVSIAKGFNAPESAKEQFWLGGTRGAFEYAVFAAETLPHDDQFVIDVLVLAAMPGQTQAVAEARAQTLMNAVVQALEPVAGQFLSLGTVTDPGVSEAHIIDALLSSAEGPHTEPREEGHVGYGSVEVSIHTRSRYL